jgi:GT2 family glycosyltransferase/glycosyltransferase involved in cell wall biosynthesis
MKSVDIVIVNHNSTDDAEKAIESILNTTDGVVPHIVVADNASNDRPERLVQRFPQIRLLLSEKNLGYSKAINRALRKCDSAYVVIMNPDTFVLNGFFADVLNYLESNVEVGVVGPKIFDADGSVQGSARRFPTPWSYAFGRKSPITRIFPKNRLTQKEFMCFDCAGTREIPVDWVSGACMVIRRDVFDAVGGFDERFFLYWEDTDLCKRISAAGWRIVYYPKAEIKHLVGVSSSKSPLKSICHFHHSCYKLFEKHTQWPMRIFTPVTFFALAVRCFFAILLDLINRAIEGRPGRFAKANGKRACQKPKIKIVRIVSRMNIGGPSIHVALLTRKLDQEKFESKLVIGSISSSEGNMNYLLQEDPRVLSIPELQREIDLIKDLRAFIKLFKLLIREKPAIVDTHTAKAGLIGRLATFVYRFLSGRKVYVVHTFHGNVFGGYFSKLKSRLFVLLERMLAQVTDVIIALSPTQKMELVEKYRIAESQKVHVKNLGFDLSPFLDGKGHHNGNFRKKWDLNKDTLLVGIIGRLVAIKNHRMFLDAAHLFLKRNAMAIKFLIVGDGEERHRLENYAKALGIADSVVFCGWEKEIEKVYAELDILALTSINEGTPVSIIEAMAASVPILTTEVGGVKDLLGEPEKVGGGKNGFKVCQRGIMCPIDDPLAFAGGIEFILEKKLRNLDHAPTANARDYVMTHYSEKRLVDDMQKLYQHLARH